MKITRQKHAKKHLSFFRNNFGVREPYQILLDGTFCQAALRGRIQLREQLPRYLMGETQLCTTRWARRVRGGGPGGGPAGVVEAEARGAKRPAHGEATAQALGRPGGVCNVGRKRSATGKSSAPQCDLASSRGPSPTSGVFSGELISGPWSSRL